MILSFSSTRSSHVGFLACLLGWILTGLGELPVHGQTNQPPNLVIPGLPQSSVRTNGLRMARPASSTNGIRVVAPAAARPAPQITVTPTPSGPPAPAPSDPLANLMFQQPAIDTETPVTVTAEFDPPVVALGQRATYRLVIRALKESIKIPDALPVPEGLELTPGARGERFDPVGSKLLPATTVHFRVSARAPGEYRMPSFALTAYGKAVAVPEARVRFVAADSPAALEAPRLILELPEGDLYVGQTLVVRVLLLGLEGSNTAGLVQVQVGGQGFMSEATIFGQQRELFVRNGKALPALLQLAMVTPIQEGTNLLMAQGQAIITPGPTPRPGQVAYLNTLVDSDPVAVTVRRLPKEGELPGFTGAIGQFQLETPTVSTTELRAGDPLTLSVRVKGEGNLGRLLPPKLERARGWQVFPPLLDSAMAAEIQQRGWCLFTYTLIPLSDRAQATPAIPFSYFNPKKKTYVDLTIPPVAVKVAPAPAGTPGASTVAEIQSATLETAEDSSGSREPVLTGIMEHPGRQVASLVPLQQRPWFLGLQLVLALGLAGLWTAERRRRYLDQHPDVPRRHQACCGLRRQLRIARRAVTLGDAAGFVTASVDALREACAPWEAANPGALVSDDILRRLNGEESKGRSGEIVRQLFTAADSMRFGGSTPDARSLLNLLPEVEQLLARLRKRL